METLNYIFSFICGQERCFVIDGAALPLCQRCLGLYVAAGATAIWMLLCGIWRRGLASWSVFVANVAVLLAAILGGVGVFDAGPTWRLICGLWTGHVVMLWLVGGTVHLWSLSRPQRPLQLPWLARHKLQALAAPAVLGGLAGLFGELHGLGCLFWSGAGLFGAAALLVAVITAAVSLGVYCIRTLPARAARPQPDG